MWPSLYQYSIGLAFLQPSETHIWSTCPGILTSSQSLTCFKSYHGGGGCCGTGGRGVKRQKGSPISNENQKELLGREAYWNQRAGTARYYSRVVITPQNHRTYFPRKKIKHFNEEAGGEADCWRVSEAKPKRIRTYRFWNQAGWYSLYLFQGNDYLVLGTYIIEIYRACTRRQLFQEGAYKPMFLWYL